MVGKIYLFLEYSFPYMILSQMYWKPDQQKVSQGLVIGHALRKTGGSSKIRKQLKNDWCDFQRLPFICKL